MGERRVVLAAGGTGGHMFPAQALAEELIKRDWKPALITDARGLALAGRFPAEPVVTIKAATVSPRNPLKALLGAVRIAGGYATARSVLKELRPDVIVGFGGYPAFPTLAAAGKVPIVVHEQNAVLGRVNRIFAKKAKVVASGFKRLERTPNAATYRWKIVGNPVRAAIETARETPYVPPEDGEIRLLVLGGSLGARILSEITPRAVARLPEALRQRLRVSQQTREDYVDHAKSVYEKAGVACDCRPFFDDVAERMADAHMIVARAGASTVTEIAVVGRPSVLVPLAIAMDDHQTLNAEALAEAGAADVIKETEFDGQKLAAILEQRLSAPQDLSRRAAAAKAAGRPDAAQALADIVEKVAQGQPV
jgi:UDP-N-acetylglucosamine--N-acetylmuramyl-(pentapeptide) pyrophosphoryl-undecaprenol N-acetylglucosamine transferase